ncbi:hypothetical protein F4824DRAFT_208412 [Ustulina deusta]|nr:hypothetical protein F4824DRAFT_208412 [Ustulina deusta]
MTTTARTFLKETGTNRTMNATKAKARLVMLIEPTAWTEEEDTVLKAVFEHHDTWAARLSAFQLATGRSRTVRCLTKRAKVLGLDLVTKGGKPWTEEEDKFLEHLFPIRDNWKDIYDKFHRKFGPNRTFISVQAKRASRSHPLPSHQRWTKEELDFLDFLSAPTNWREIAREFEKKVRIPAETQFCPNFIRGLVQAETLNVLQIK